MTKRNALAMIALAKQHGSRVVIGGPDPPHHAASYLDAGADVVVIGEGEQTLEELLPALLAPPSSLGDSRARRFTASPSSRRTARWCARRRGSCCRISIASRFRIGPRSTCRRISTPGASGTASARCR